MKAKTSSGTNTNDITRYEPVDDKTYPLVVEEGGYIFDRFYCREFFIVYEKYKNNVKLGYLVFPGGKEIFSFNTLMGYVETIKGGTVMCRSVREKKG